MSIVLEYAKVIAALDRCIAILAANNIPAQMTGEQKGLRHVHWMAVHMKQQLGDSAELVTLSDLTKANRWLAFVQADMIHNGLTTVGIERDSTRDIFTAKSLDALHSHSPLWKTSDYPVLFEKDFAERLMEMNSIYLKNVKNMFYVSDRRSVTDSSSGLHRYPVAYWNDATPMPDVFFDESVDLERRLSTMGYMLDHLADNVTTPFYMSTGSATSYNALEYIPMQGTRGKLHILRLVQRKQQSYKCPLFIRITGVGDPTIEDAVLYKMMGGATYTKINHAVDTTPLGFQRSTNTYLFHMKYKGL